MSYKNLTMFDNSISKTSYELKEGDVINSPSLGEIYFERWKRGMQSYVCVQISSGKRYKSRVSNAYSTKFDVIGNYNVQTPADKFGDDSKNLVAGDLFLIERKNACEVFKFVSYGRTGKITACSPVDDTKQWSIDKSFPAIKIANL